MNKTKLLKVLNQFVKTIDPELSVVYGEEFYYTIAKSRITVALEMDWRTDTFVNALIRDYSPKVELEAFIWSLLHEIGHHESDINEMTDEEEENSLFLRQLVRVLDVEEAEKIYFNLPEEKEATLWAVDWAENNLDTLNKWIKKFAKC